jgi:transcription elongation factor SPT5
MALMKKFIGNESGTEPLEIYSAYSRPSFPGYVYVEARKVTNVQKVL